METLRNYDGAGTRAALGPAFPAALFGIEQEFEIFSGTEQRDFRRLIHSVVAASNNDACRAGPVGYFLSTGTLLICDGWEAELAAPPEAVVPGLFQRLPELARRRQNELLDHLEGYTRQSGDTLSPQGFSTHLSIASAGVDLGKIAHMYAVTTAPAMMMLFDQRTSPGLLVRPRPQRFEIGGDYIAPGDLLSAVALFFAGSFLRVIDAVLGGDAMAMPFVFDDSRLQPTIRRRGLFVDRRAFGEDLYTNGRRARLRLADGRTIRAQTLLEELWQSVRSYAETVGGTHEVRLVDEVVKGDRPLPMEVEDADYTAVRRYGSEVGGPGGVHPFAACLRRFDIDGRCASPELATWDYIVYRINGTGSPRFLNVPRPSLSGWLQAVNDGSAKAWLEKDGGVPVTPRLINAGQAESVGVYESIDADALGERFGSAKKKKKKKTPEPAVCQAGIDGGSVTFCVQEVVDNQRTVVDQEPPQNAHRIAHDVLASNGTFVHEHVDHMVRGRGFDFNFLRYYRSGIDYDGPLGRTWDHAFNIRLVLHPSPTAKRIPGGFCEVFDPAREGGSITFYEGNGRVTQHAFASWETRQVAWCDASFRALVTTFRQNDGESFEIQHYAVIGGTPPPAVAEANFFRIRYAGGLRLLFNCHGRLMEVRNPQHQRIRCEYGLPFDPGTRYFTLRRIIDTLGQTHRLDYRVIADRPRIVRLTDHYGRQLRFDYDDAVQLVQVTLAGGDAGTPRIGYRYASGQRPGVLSEIVNPEEAAGSGESWLQNTYDAAGRVVRQRVGAATAGGAGGTYAIRYPNDRRIDLKDRTNVDWTFALRRIGNAKVIEAVSVEDEVGTDGRIAVKRLETGFEYDRHYHITKITHPSGITERYVFRNRNAPVLDGEAFDDEVLQIAHHNNLGRDALTRHDRIGAGGSPTFTTTYTHDWLFVNKLEVRSPAGLMRFTYDHGRCDAPQYNANPLRVEYQRQLLPDGSEQRVIEAFDYAPGGIVKYHKDPDGIEQSWDIDAKGRPTRHFLGGQVEEERRYDDRGNLSSVRDNRGFVTRFTYDNRDLLIESTDPLNHTTRFEYNLNDWRTMVGMDRVDDPTSLAGIEAQAAVRLTDSTTYDILGNRLGYTETGTSPTETLSRTRRWRYDAEGRTAMVESARAVSGEQTDARVTNRYNARGLIRETIIAEGGPNAGTTRTAYDEDGRVALQIDPQLSRILSRYDSIGRPVEEAFSNGTRRHLEYRGSVLAREWVEGPLNARPTELGGSALVRVLREIEFEVDAMQRPIKRTFKVFDPRQRASLKDPVDGNWIEQTWFTPAGRVSRQQDPAGHTTRFDWNDQGRMAQITLPAGHTIAYDYEGDLVSTETTTLRPASGVAGPLPPRDLTLREQKRYDALGRLVRHETVNGTVIRRAFDSQGNERAKRTPLSANEFALTQIHYDPLGRVKRQVAGGIPSVSNPDGRMTLMFEYDLNDNVRTLIDDLGRTTRVTYDGRDQVLSADQPDVGQTRYERRADGRVTRVTRGSGESTRYEYASSGVITAVATTDSSGQRIDQRFGFDGLNRLYWAIDSNGGNAYRVQTYRSPDSLGRVIAERTVIPEFDFDKSIRYTHDAGKVTQRYPDGRFLVIREVDSEGNTKRITLSDLGVALENWHQGPGRLLQTDRAVTLVESDNNRRVDLTVRTGERFDPMGRPNFRGLYVSDEINRPNRSNFIPLATQAERTRYGANGLPAQRDYGIVSDPGLSVEEQTFYDGLARVRLVSESEGRDVLNLDYDWDGAGRLNAVNQTGIKDGKALNRRTTIEYQGNQRIDRTRNLEELMSSTTWTFDAGGRLQESAVSEPEGRRTFAYDAEDRLRQVDVFSSGLLSTSQDTTNFLYDALGRLVARSTADEREYFVYDGMAIVEEFDRTLTAVRRYVHDRGQVVCYGQRDPKGTWQSYYPLVNGVGSPWVLIAATPQVDVLPPAPGDDAVVTTRGEYFRQRVPLIVEEHRSRPFETDGIIRYDYADGIAEAEAVTESLMPLDSGGRRYFAKEGLLLNGPRFYDPALRSFITPDPLGAWGHGMAYGNPYAYAGNNPVVFGDDGRAVIVGILAVVAIGALIGAGISAVRQGAQIKEGSREEFSFGEVGFSALVGGGLAPLLVFAPELIVPLAAYGASDSYAQYRTGQIGGLTLGFDAAVLALPFAVSKTVRSAVFGRNSLLTRGPAAGGAARFGQFKGIGRMASRIGRSRGVPEAGPQRFRLDPRTLQMLEELGGRVIEEPVAPEALESIRASNRLGRGQQGEVYRVVGSREELTLKMFEHPEGAANEVFGLYEWQAAIEAANPGTVLDNVSVVRVRYIGRTTNGNSFLIKGYASGELTWGTNWLLNGGNAALQQARLQRFPHYGDQPIFMYENLVMNRGGQVTIFDPI